MTPPGSHPPPPLSSLTFPDINSALSTLAARPITLNECTKTPLAGGCISQAWTISHPDLETMVYKENHGVPDNFFPAEAQGLLMLAETSVPALHIPQVYAVLPEGILMEYLHTATPASASTRAHSRTFGRALALFHKQSAEQPPAPCYGLEQDNYLGLTPQPNSPSENWAAFFAEHRLARQLSLAEDTHRATPAISRGIEKLIDRLETLIPDHPSPSLLHGDLWGGNYMTITLADTVQTAIIDPAVYRGHYEADLAMTALFGGFDDSFYQGYAEITPFEKEYDLRREIYNLYHLLNHLNLFGSGYISSIMASFRILSSKIVLK